MKSVLKNNNIVHYLIFGHIEIEGILLSKEYLGTSQTNLYDKLFEKKTNQNIITYNLIYDDDIGYIPSLKLILAYQPSRKNIYLVLHLIMKIFGSLFNSTHKLFGTPLFSIHNFATLLNTKLTAIEFVSIFISILKNHEWSIIKDHNLIMPIYTRLLYIYNIIYEA